jgi:hypothetical protein
MDRQLALIFNYFFLYTVQYLCTQPSRLQNERQGAVMRIRFEQSFDHRNHPELRHSSLHYRLRHQSCHCATSPIIHYSRNYFFSQICIRQEQMRAEAWKTFLFLHKSEFFSQKGKCLDEFSRIFSRKHKFSFQT